MSRLAVAAEEYLNVRRALGFKLRPHTRWLRDFVSYLEARGRSVITTDLALEWARQPKDTAPANWGRRLSAVRMFAEHHRASDARTEIPAADLIPYRPQRCRPYVYSPQDLAALMKAGRSLSSPLLSASYTTLFGLLAATGMRVSEALALDVDDVDWSEGVLTIRHTKFGKSRHVPLHRSTLAALRQYDGRRNQLMPHRRSAAFFVSRVGTRIFYQTLSSVFLRLIHVTGLDRGSHRRPRIHDLRHTFAMTTLRDWYRAGVDVERRLSHLSTYLGHVKPSTTYWYLSATPELLASAGERAERAWRARP